MINWDAFKQSEWNLMGRTVPGGLDVAKQVVEAMTDSLEGSTALALDAIWAISEAGFKIVRSEETCE